MKRVMVVAALVAVFLAGRAASPDLADDGLRAATSPGLSEAPSTSTVSKSPDGTISVTLPAGWNDFSAEYFVTEPSSDVSAFWGAGSGVDDREAPTATVATEPAISTKGDARTVALMASFDWQSTVGGANTTEKAFTTVDGGDGYWFRVEGVDQGSPIIVISAAIQSKGRTATIAIQATPDTVGVAESLVDALETVTLAPLTPDEVQPGEVIGGIFTDGSIDITAPTEWDHPLSDRELVKGAFKARAHLYGGWLLGDDAAGPPSYVELIVLDAPPDIDLAKRARDDFGEPGTLTASRDGVVPVVSVSDVSYPNGATGVIGCHGKVAGPVDVANTCWAQLVFGKYWIFATVVGVDDHPDAMEQTEHVLASLRLP